MAKVFASDKILFSAKKVAIQMPTNQSPLISISGYPSSQLGFLYWTELILMLETQPTLKESLQIRRVRVAVLRRQTTLVLSALRGRTSAVHDVLTTSLSPWHTWLAVATGPTLDRPDPKRDERAEGAEPEAPDGE